MPLDISDRKSLMIALGGGVVGDIVGFASGIYQRGIDFVQIPTTLLSQVDASVGGKTGINNAFGKISSDFFINLRQCILIPICLKALKKGNLQQVWRRLSKWQCVLIKHFMSGF